MPIGQYYDDIGFVSARGEIRRALILDSRWHGCFCPCGIEKGAALAPPTTCLAYHPTTRLAPLLKRGRVERPP